MISIPPLHIIWYQIGGSKRCGQLWITEIARSYLNLLVCHQHLSFGKLWAYDMEAVSYNKKKEELIVLLNLIS